MSEVQGNQLNALLARVPAVERVMSSLAVQPLLAEYGRTQVLAAVRATLDTLRCELQTAASAGRIPRRCDNANANRRESRGRKPPGRTGRISQSASLPVHGPRRDAHCFSAATLHARRAFRQPLPATKPISPGKPPFCWRSVHKAICAPCSISPAPCCTPTLAVPCCRTKP